MIESTTAPGALLAGDRTEYRLGKKIAEGGEGIVYRVEGRSDIVAKIYREFDYTREAKLRQMVGVGNKRLHRVCAWPLSILQEPDAKIAGFVMQRLEGWQPLHTIYQVKHRLEHHPNRTWDFLVRTARNLAVCVHHIHEAGCVIGDLNESNVLVDDKAMVKIIDCDSFQVAGYRCQVAKPELLAPELQGRDLSDLDRTVEHDRFALAVLLFQTLVFGRHPYAGRPKDDEERTLEACIQKGYYAFTENRSVPLSPPPYLDLSFLSPEIKALFERAFGLEPSQRPDAHEWFGALRRLGQETATCRESPKHRHWHGLDTCPWCRIEAQGNTTLFRSELEIDQLQLDSATLWAEIEAWAKRMPALEDVERLDYRKMEPGTEGWIQKGFQAFMKMPFLFFIIFFNAFRGFEPHGPFLFGLAALLVVVVLAHTIPRMLLKRADKDQEKVWKKAQDEASTQVLTDRIEELKRMRDHLANFSDFVAESRQRALEKKYARQLQNYLRKYSLLAADIGPYGRDKLTQLHQKGFQTAADISEAEVIKLVTLSQELRLSLLHWKRSLEQQFWSTSSMSLSPQEERQLAGRLRREALDFRRQLQEAPEELDGLLAKIRQRQDELRAEAKPFEARIRKLGPMVLATEEANRKRSQRS